MFELVFGVRDGDLEAVDFAGPSVLMGFVETGKETRMDLFESWLLCGVDSQHRAADAGVFVDARCGVGASAGAEFDFAVFEVVEELVPFGVGDISVLFAGALLSAAGDEGSVVVDDVVVVDRDVALGGVEAFVAEDLGGDVNWKPGCDCFGGEDAPEVVGRDPGGRPVGMDNAGKVNNARDQDPGLGGVDHCVDQALAALKQERKQRAVDSLGVIETPDEWHLPVGVADPLDHGGEDFAEFGADDEEAFAVGLRGCDLEQWDCLAGGWQRVRDEAAVGDFGEFFDADPGVAQHFDDCPPPKRTVFFVEEVASFAITAVGHTIPARPFPPRAGSAGAT